MIELMVTIAVAAILASIGAPALQKTIQNNRLSAMHNELMAALSFTRNVAVSSGSTATLCKRKNTGSACADVAHSWRNGWLIFKDKDNDGMVDADETILQEKTELEDQVSMIYSRNLSRVSYNSQGYAYGYAGAFTFCDKRGDSAKKGMVISANGRVRVADKNDALSACPQ